MQDWESRGKQGFFAEEWDRVERTGRGVELENLWDTAFGQMQGQEIVDWNMRLDGETTTGLG